MGVREGVFWQVSPGTAQGPEWVLDLVVVGQLGSGQHPVEQGQPGASSELARVACAGLCLVAREHRLPGAPSAGWLGLWAAGSSHVSTRGHIPVPTVRAQDNAVPSPRAKGLG